MEILNIQSLERAVRIEGFDGAVVIDLVHATARQSLVDGCPEGLVSELDVGNGPGRAGDGYLGGKLSVVDLPVDGSTLTHPWRLLLAELFSTVYERRIGALAGVNLSAASRRGARLLTYRTGGFLGPHFDNQRGKLLTQVIFINDRWHETWGGHFDFLACDRSTVLHSILPVMENSVVNQCSQKAWHRVNAVLPAAAIPRRSLIIEWFGPAGH
jgi:hypothetical protein